MLSSWYNFKANSINLDQLVDLSTYVYRYFRQKLKVFISGNDPKTVWCNTIANSIIETAKHFNGVVYSGFELSNSDCDKVEFNE